jgi:CDP-glucose 4,6-dehydratase
VILRDEPVLTNFRLLGLSTRVNVVRGSVTDATLVGRVLAEYEIDTCFHLAAQAIVGIANRSPVSTFESNIHGTWSVLEACRMSKSIERVVVASSDKAYGAQPVLPYTEDMPLLGINPYDASKVCADLIARCYADAYKTPIAVARCANIYGGGDLNFSRLIPGTIRSALSGERPVVRSDGTPVRDYLYIEDAVRAYLALAEHLPDGTISGRAFNFGTDSPISVRNLVRRILDVCGSSDVEPDVRGAGPPAGEIACQYLNCDQARAALGWTAEISLEDGLRWTASWYAKFIGAADRIAASAVGAFG